MVDDVAEVQPFWAQLPLADRARYMRRAAQAIIDQLDDLTHAAHARAGQAAHRVLLDGAACPRSTRCAGWPRPGRSILADERVPHARCSSSRSARASRYEPLGVVGVIAPWNYPWSIPFGEVAIALMAGQRRGAQAGVAHAADRPAHPGRLRARRAARGDRPHDPRRRRGRPGAGRVERGQDLLHRLGGGGQARGRGVRRADEGLGARARRQGPDDRVRRRQPAERHLGLPLGRLRQRRPDLLGHRARVRRCARWPTASSRASSQGAKALRVGDPMELEHRGRPDGLARPVRDRARAGRRRGGERRDAALRRAGATPGLPDAASTPPPCSPASPTTCGSCARRSSGRWCRS